MKKVKIGLLALLFTFVSAAVPVNQVKVSAQSGITRSEAEKRALKIINLTWTYSKEKHSNIDPKYAGIVTQPAQFNNVTTAKVTGIPYNWGGLDSLETRSYNQPWSDFLDAVSKGAFMGNVNSKGGIGLVPGTAGLDCSGFVQAVFNIGGSKISTSTMFNKHFKKISLQELRHMDVLNYAGNHTVIFDRWGTRNGVEGAYTYEATANQQYGGIQGTKRYFISRATINTGYIPGRYVNIIEDGSSQQVQVQAPAVSKQPSPTPAPAAVKPKDNKANAVSSTNANQSESAKKEPSIQQESLYVKPDKTVLSLLSGSNGRININYGGNPIWNLKEISKTA